MGIQRRLQPSEVPRFSHLVPLVPPMIADRATADAPSPANVPRSFPDRRRKHVPNAISRLRHPKNDPLARREAIRSNHLDDALEIRGEKEGTHRPNRGIKGTRRGLVQTRKAVAGLT